MENLTTEQRGTVKSLIRELKSKDSILSHLTEKLEENNLSERK